MKTEDLFDVMDELPEYMIQDAADCRMKAPAPRRRVLRTALLAAALVMLLTVTAYAASGNLAGYHSSTREATVWTRLYMLPEAEKKLGSSLTVPDRFENGFSFLIMDIHYIEHTDAEGTVIETFPEFRAQFKRSGDTVTLNAEETRQQPHDDTWSERKSGDVSVWCKSQTMKAVPEDYQVTEEDQAGQDSGELILSWGSDKEGGVRMNLWDILILSAVAAAVLHAILRMRRRRGNGCGCGCDGCGADCGKRQKQ